MKPTPTSTPARRLYPNLKAKDEDRATKRPPVDGWARKQREASGENVDHVLRGPVSPLGGQVKRASNQKETQK